MLGQVSSVSEKISDQTHKDASEGKKFDSKTTSSQKHNKHLDLDTGVSSVK